MSSASYDGDGLRSSETSSPGGTQSFVWNTVSSVPELIMDTTNAYIYGTSGSPVEQVNLSTGATSYLVSDSLGSVRGVVSSSGSLTSSVNYDAWGNPETAGGLTSYTPFGFAGGYTDPSGLVYLIARYYDPATGQFLSVDPLVPETRAAFVYAEDDPVTVTDPTGLYNCSGKSAGFLVARYQRGDARYSLVCGTSAYGVRHIQSKHFAGDLSKVLITFLIRLTISRGKPYEGSGDSTPNPYTKAYKQGFTWSSSGFPETEVFHIIAVVNTRYGRVTTAYSPESIVDQNQLDDCHFAGIDACANFGTL